MRVSPTRVLNHPNPYGSVSPAVPMVGENASALVAGLRNAPVSSAIEYFATSSTVETRPAGMSDGDR